MESCDRRSRRFRDSKRWSTRLFYRILPSAEAGVDCIKVYDEIGLEAYEAIATAAKQHGLPLVGHVPHGVGMERVFDFEAQHMTGIPYLSRPRPPTGWDIRNEDILAMTDGEIDRALDVALRQRISGFD